MQDSDIDYSDIPPLGQDFFRKGDSRMAAGKEATDHPP